MGQKPNWLSRILAAFRNPDPLPEPYPPAPEPLPMVSVTAELLTRLGWVAPSEYAAALGPACRSYSITTPTRLAAFLAQVGHESGGGRHTREIWGPTPAQLRYEGRADLGNHLPGDGRRFLGRGLIQVTGRANTYGALGALRPQMSIDEFCAWLESRPGAAESACWWWAKHGCNEIADSGDFERLTRRINGKLNGLADRRQRWVEAKAALNL